jgi:hypothetical protein
MTTKCGYMSSKGRHTIPWKKHKVLRPKAWSDHEFEERNLWLSYIKNMF